MEKDNTVTPEWIEAMAKELSNNLCYGTFSQKRITDALASFGTQIYQHMLPTPLQGIDEPELLCLVDFKKEFEKAVKQLALATEVSTEYKSKINEYSNIEQGLRREVQELKEAIDKTDRVFEKMGVRELYYEHKDLTIKLEEQENENTSLRENLEEKEKEIKELEKALQSYNDKLNYWYAEENKKSSLLTSKDEELRKMREVLKEMLEYPITMEDDERIKQILNNQ